jgi:sulfate adenylyltransferase subunit 2
MQSYTTTHLRQLEAEAIFVLRETAAQFEKPAMLFSGGKDSIVMAHLARKAFFPAKLPFPLVHIDTGHNFEETMTYRDWFVEDVGARLVVGSVQESIDKGTAVEEKGPNASRNRLQTITLLETIEAGGFDAALGGGRRLRAVDQPAERMAQSGPWGFRGLSGQLQCQPAAQHPPRTPLGV